MSNLVLVVGGSQTGKKSLLAAIRACAQGGGGGDGGDILGPWTLETKYYTAPLSFELVTDTTALNQDRLDEAQGIVFVVNLSQNESIVSTKSIASALDFTAVEPALFVGTHIDVVVSEQTDSTTTSSSSEQKSVSSPSSHKELSNWAGTLGLEFVAVNALTEGSDRVPSMSLSSGQETTGVPRVVEALHTTPWPELVMKPRGPSGVPMKPNVASTIANSALAKVESALKATSSMMAAEVAQSQAPASKKSSRPAGFKLTVPPALSAYSPDIRSPTATAQQNVPDLLKNAVIVDEQGPGSYVPPAAPASSSSSSSRKAPPANLSVPPALAAYSPDIRSPTATARQNLPDLLKREDVVSPKASEAPVPVDTEATFVDKWLKDNGLDALDDLDDLESAFDALKGLRAQAATLPDDQRREVAAKVAMFFWSKMNDGEGDEIPSEVDLAAMM